MCRPILIVAIWAPPIMLHAQTLDSAMVRIERSASVGDRARAHSIADSLCSVLSPDSDRYPDALYWRAATATNASEAEHDYLRVGLDFPLSSHAAAALLNLGQLENARHDRLAARRHFDQLVREHPTDPLVAKAGYWSARAAFDDGLTDAACAALAVARTAVATDDTELKNQIDYSSTRCMAVTQVDSGARTATDTSTERSTGGTARRANPLVGKEFSIQVAAFAKRSDAAALAAQLRRNGYPSRVAGTHAPYRVRIGRYVSRDSAAATLARVKRGNPHAMLVDAEPR